MNNLSLMAGFGGWVNGRMYASVAELSDADYRRDCQAFFGSVHATLNHLLVVDRLWTARVEGTDHGIESLDQILYDDLAGLGAARRGEDARLIALVDGFSAAELAAPVTYTRMLGSGQHTTRRDRMLLTLYNHQTHHRGQVHALLTQARITPEPWDVIFYLEEAGLS